VKTKDATYFYVEGEEPSGVKEAKPVTPEEE
jgi:hypothetical protein